MLPSPGLCQHPWALCEALVISFRWASISLIISQFPWVSREGTDSVQVWPRVTDEDELAKGPVPS